MRIKLKTFMCENGNINAQTNCIARSVTCETQLFWGELNIKLGVRARLDKFSPGVILLFSNIINVLLNLSIF